jgi:hypothetical protein
VDVKTGGQQELRDPLVERRNRQWLVDVALNFKLREQVGLLSQCSDARDQQRKGERGFAQGIHGSGPLTQVGSAPQALP